jgi:hypothetical protein
VAGVGEEIGGVWVDPVGSGALGFGPGFFFFFLTFLSFLIYLGV